MQRGNERSDELFDVLFFIFCFVLIAQFELNIRYFITFVFIPEYCEFITHVLIIDAESRSMKISGVVAHGVSSDFWSNWIGGLFIVTALGL